MEKRARERVKSNRLGARALMWWSVLAVARLPRVPEAFRLEAPTINKMIV